MLPPTFLIGVDLHDGRWLTIEPSHRAARRRLAQSLASIFVGTLLIAAIAVLTARSLHCASLSACDSGGCARAVARNH